MPLNRLSILPAACVLALSFLTGCQSEDEARARHLSQGNDYLESERFAEATIEFKNAIQIDPNDPEAHYGLARALLQQGKAREGFWELRETVRLDPEHRDAVVQFAQISIYAGELEEALAHADRLVVQEPDDHRGWLIKAQAHDGLNQPDEALRSFEKAVEVSPDNVPSILVLANYHRRNGDRDLAEPIFRDAAERLPDNDTLISMATFYAEDRERAEEAEPYYRRAIEAAEGDEVARAYALFGNYLYARERGEDAVAVLEEGIDKAEDPVDLIYLLARVYSLEDREEEADALLERATTADPSNPRPFLVLSSYLGGKGDLAGAFDAAEKAVEADPENEDARLRKAELLLEIGYRDDAPEKVDEGRRIVEEVLAAEPTSSGGLFVKAKIDMAGGDNEAAIQALRSAIDVRPDWAQAHFLLGSALRVVGQRSAARTELARALEIDASLLDARRILAGVHASLGEHEYAIEEARRYLSERPDSPGVRVQLAESLVILGRPDEALAEMESIPEEARDERVAFALGRIYSLRGNDEEARKQLLRAYEAVPGQVQVLRALLTLEERMGMTEVGLERIRQALEADPENAELQQVSGQVALAQRRADDAIAHFEKAIELDPDDTDSYRYLADVYVRTGRTAQTIETYQKALEVQPDQPRIHHFLGVLYEMGGQADKAVTHYEKAIDIKPDLAESKNNLAYLYAERGENLDRALDLAQDAKSLMPDDPNTADTLGWVLHQRGASSAAITYLREAEAGFEPGDANLGLIRHHLALAYEASGDQESARDTLDRAIEAYESFVESQRSRGRPVGSDPEWYSEARKMRARL